MSKWADAPEDDDEVPPLPASFHTDDTVQGDASDAPADAAAAPVADAADDGEMLR
jgi:hypothetical protein